MALTFIQLFRSKSQVSLVTLSLLYTLELNNHQFLLRYLLNISWINFLSSSPVISSIIKTNRLSPELHLWSPMWCLCPISTSPSLETYSLLGWYVWNVNEFLTPLLTSLSVVYQWPQKKAQNLSQDIYWFGPYLCFHSPFPGHEGTCLLSLFNTMQSQL